MAYDCFELITVLIAFCGCSAIDSHYSFSSKEHPVLPERSSASNRIADSNETRPHSNVNKDADEMNPGIERDHSLPTEASDFNIKNLPLIKLQENASNESVLDDANVEAMHSTIDLPDDKNKQQNKLHDIYKMIDNEIAEQKEHALILKEDLDLFIEQTEVKFGEIVKK
ncbi:hypothetical protein ENBRE01_3263, partial [Enteropsectra breve]